GASAEVEHARSRPQVAGDRFPPLAQPRQRHVPAGEEGVRFWFAVLDMTSYITATCITATYITARVTGHRRHHPLTAADSSDGRGPATGSGAVMPAGPGRMTRWDHSCCSTPPRRTSVRSTACRRR